jgi:hypothetical protein
VTVAKHIDAESALFLVALDDTDPEKRAAFTHAADCASCLRLIHESQAMLQLIDRESALVEVDAGLETRVRAALFEGKRERSVGRLEYLAWLAGAFVSGLMIWLDAKPGQPLYAEVGLRCMRFELGFAVIALGAGVLWTRSSGRELGPLRASVLAMTGALIGQALLRIRCEAHDAALHLLAFHLVGVVIATVLGAVAGRLLPKSA